MKKQTIKPGALVTHYMGEKFVIDGVGLITDRQGQDQEIVSLLSSTSSKTAIYKLSEFTGQVSFENQMVDLFVPGHVPSIYQLRNFARAYVELCDRFGLMVAADGEDVDIGPADAKLWGIRRVAAPDWNSKAHHGTKGFLGPYCSSTRS